MISPWAALRCKTVDASGASGQSDTWYAECGMWTNDVPLISIHLNPLKYSGRHLSFSFSLSLSLLIFFFFLFSTALCYFFLLFLWGISATSVLSLDAWPRFIAIRQGIPGYVFLCLSFFLSSFSCWFLFIFFFYILNVSNRGRACALVSSPNRICQMMEAVVLLMLIVTFWIVADQRFVTVSTLTAQILLSASFMHVYIYKHIVMFVVFGCCVFPAGNGDVEIICARNQSYYFLWRRIRMENAEEWQRAV